jgi:hypothetical protein
VADSVLQVVQTISLLMPGSPSQLSNGHSIQGCGQYDVLLWRNRLLRRPANIRAAVRLLQQATGALQRVSSHCWKLK